MPVDKKYREKINQKKTARKSKILYTEIANTMYSLDGAYTGRLHTEIFFTL